MAVLLTATDSSRFSLGRTDLRKLGKSFGLTLVASALVMATDALQLIDWTSWSWGPLVALTIPFLVNVARKFLTDSRAAWQKATDHRRGFS